MLDKVLGVSGAVVEGAETLTHACEGGTQLDETARLLEPLGSPVIVFSASHSGSRLLALLLSRLGVFMGSHLNDSEDSVDVFELVRHLVEAHAPDYSKLFCDGDPTLQRQGARPPSAPTWPTDRRGSAGAGSCRRPLT